MAKVTISSIATGHKSQATIDANFALLVAELNNNVLYRNNPAGETNQMENDIDMNSNDLINVDNIATTTMTIGGVSVQSNTLAESIPVLTGSDAYKLPRVNAASDGYELAVQPNTGFKNLFRNGGMRVNQRAQTYNAAYFGTALVSCLDGVVFRDDNAGTPVFTVTQKTTPVADVASVGGCIDFIEFEKTDLNSNVNTLDPLAKFIIEDVEASAGKVLTFSYYAEFTTGVIKQFPDVQLTQNFGTAGSSSVVTSMETAVTATGSWARYDYTVTVPAVTGKTIGAGHHIQLLVSFPPDQLYKIKMTGIQIEQSDHPTVFEHRPEGVDRSLCERYYIKKPANGALTNIVVPIPDVGGATAGINRGLTIIFPCSMRVVPTITILSPNAAWTGGAPSVADINEWGFRAYGTENNIGATTTGFGGYEADAELV